MFNFGVNKKQYVIMGLRFKVIDYKLEIDEHVLLFDEFKSIVKADKHRKKKRAKQILTYLYLREDLGAMNPLSSMKYEDRKKRAEYIIFGEGGCKFNKKEQAMFDEALPIYVEMSSTPEERILFNLNEDIDQQNKMMSMNKKVLRDGLAKLDDSSNDYMLKVSVLNKEYSDVLKGILANLKSLNEEKKRVVDMIKGNVGGQIRGNKGLSLSEQGMFNNIKSKVGK